MLGTKTSISQVLKQSSDEGAIGRGLFGKSAVTRATAKFLLLSSRVTCGESFEFEYDMIS